MYTQMVSGSPPVGVVWSGGGGAAAAVDELQQIQNRIITNRKTQLVEGFGLLSLCLDNLKSYWP